MRKLAYVVAGAATVWAGQGASHELTPPLRSSASVSNSIPLERRSYINGLTLIARHFPGEERGSKIQMMTIGDRRILVQSVVGTGKVARVGLSKSTVQFLDVTDPKRPVILSEGNVPGGQIQLAYNRSVGKWILIVSHQIHQPGTPGLRGVSIYDATDPADVKLLSRWSADAGDPDRAIQTGSGPHRNYYDGGRYAYLSTAPDDGFVTKREGWYSVFEYNWGLQIIDVSDPAHPKLVSNTHMPGQRADEEAARKTWKPGEVKDYFASLHAGAYVPKRVEDGGRLAYGPWSHFGMIIHDVSDPANPKIVSQWLPEPRISGPTLEVHTVDVARLDRGFVITNPESTIPGCNHDIGDSFIVDVSNPAKPKQISKLPRPLPPKEAPYKSFCERFGRFSAHNPPFLKAPGKAAPNFTCYAWFNAGLQCYDISDPLKPRIVSYFVPEQGGLAQHPGEGLFAEAARTADNVFIEWDRSLIWLASDSGLYLLSAPELGKPILAGLKPNRWVLEGLNAGAP